MSSQPADSRRIRLRFLTGQTSRAVAGGLAAVALVATTTPAATAQSAGPGSSAAGSVDPGSLQPSVVPGSLLGAPSLSLAASTQLGAPIPLTQMLGSLAAVGSTEFDRPGSSSGNPSAPLATRDTSITSSTVRSIEPLRPLSTDEADRRAEVWTVTSGAMQREVRVEVYRAPAGVDAPNMYFLDGVGSESPSGWSGGMGWGDPEIRNRAVNVIVPTGGPSSMWADWAHDDPVLGPNRWETFLTEELPGMLGSGLAGVAGPLPHNGDWGVLGVSMGAASALHLANAFEMFGGAGGISGAYSTTDELGYQYARLTVAARNGDATNMWGPRGSQLWLEHDPVANPSGLSGKSVYLSAATGMVGSSELGRFGSNEMVLLDGHILEKGSFESTRALESALAEVPAVDLKMHYIPTGIHNWPVFVTEMLPATDHILSGLDPAVPNGSQTSGGVGERPGGSSGSSASLGGSLGSGGSSGFPGSLGSSGS